MRLLRLAIETRRWDLAAHTLVLGVLRTGEKESRESYGGKRQTTTPQNPRGGQKAR